MLLAPGSNLLGVPTLFWFILSLVFSIGFALPALKASFASNYLIMDDARQHLFWMQRFVDPELFPDDLIADFYQSITSPGVIATYWLMNQLGLEPIMSSKVLPMILGLIATVYCFGIGLELLPIPLMGFIGSLLLNQNLWLQGELVTATSTAFLYPTFLAFLYYLLRRSEVGVAISLVLTGLFYAPMLLIAAGILGLGLLDWPDPEVGPKDSPLGQKSSQPFRPLRLSANPEDYRLLAIGLAITLGIIWLYGGQSGEFGPTATAAEARTMPEFLDQGRTAFFYQNSFWNFWLKNSRSGIKLSLNPPIVILGFLLPIILRFPQRFPLATKVRRLGILLRLLVSSFSLFFLAHAVLFKLYLPSRYTSHSLRIVMAIATAMVLVVALDGIFKAWGKFSPVPWVTTVGLIILLVCYPKLAWKDAFPRSKYLVGAESGIYLFLQNQPKASLVASLAVEADNLPAFAQRSVLVSWEHAIPYKMGYYRQIRQRARDLIQAHYSPDPQVIRWFIDTYGVDFFVLERDAFELEYMTENSWFLQWQDLAETTAQQLEQAPPFLLQKMNSCTSFATPNLVVLEAQCLTRE
ncbi:MAG: hypothetical protein HC835_16995 [Oscillatoriales cyanobacterium RM2_1_1]|nr:hypothetical protein [Oscillatoriales cyanobacterium SM2_3_0]NJO47172.1 hypothetical protein [Oscillatoriales cyanobacterium RM2_1_1]